MNTGYMDSDLTHKAYRQGAVNVTVEFNTQLMKVWQSMDSNYKRGVYGNATAPGAFNIYTWEPLLIIDSDIATRTSVYARVIPSLNGIHDDIALDAMALGGDALGTEVIATRARYAGHSTGEWNDREYLTSNFQLGSQILGVRAFFAFRETPLNALLEVRIPTVHEAQEYTAKPPEQIVTGKVPGIIVPYNIKNIPSAFSTMYSTYLTHKLDMYRVYNVSFDKNTRLMRTLEQIKQNGLVLGISFLYAIVRDGIVNLSIPAATSMPVTINPPNAILTLPEATNWIAALATKLGLLPNSNYFQIVGNERSPDVLAKFEEYAKIIALSQCPGENAQMYFGTDRTNGTNPGYDVMTKRFLTGTLYGDMLNTIGTAQSKAIMAYTDWIYYTTRNVIGRVITPSAKGGFGAFI